MQAMMLAAPLQAEQISMSKQRTRIRRCAQVIEALRLAGVRTYLDTGLFCRSTRIIAAGWGLPLGMGPAKRTCAEPLLLPMTAFGKTGNRRSRP